MNCPACGTSMKVYEKHGVEIDVCPGCRGVWLDRGELEKILEVEARCGQSEPAPYPEERQQLDGHGYGKHGWNDHRGEKGHGEKGHHEHHEGHGRFGHGDHHGTHGRRRSLLGELFGGFADD